MHGVLILCAGEQRRLRELGYPKPLIRVAGETLLHRTVRLLREQSPAPIVVVDYVSCLKPVCEDLGIGHQDIDCGALLLSAERAMRLQGFESATILLGDVCWSRALLGQFLGECATRSTLMCARHGASEVTGKPYSEHFGCNAALEDLRRLDARRYFCLADAARNNVFGLDRMIEQPKTDFTEDFDTFSDVNLLVPLLTSLIMRQERRAA
jgi:hypothetical protein